MAELVGHDRHQVVVRVDLPVDVRVQQDVAGIGAAIGRRRQERHRQRAGAERDGTDADVAEPGVVLLVARKWPRAGRRRKPARGSRLAAFSQIEAACSICCLPGRCGELCVQRRKERAGNAADAGPVGHEAVGDAAAVDELVAQASSRAEGGPPESRGSARGHVFGCCAGPVDHDSARCLGMVFLRCKSDEPAQCLERGSSNNASAHET